MIILLQKKNFGPNVIYYVFISDQVGCWLLIAGCWLFLLVVVCCWLVHRKRKLRIQGRMQIFEKISQKALNRVLTLDCSGGGDLLQSPLKIMDLQNKNISVVKKH